jgi:hypothetical protein
MNGLKALFASQLAREFDEHVLVAFRESVLAAIANNLRFTEDAYPTDLIKKLAVSNSMYFAVMQGADEALKNSGVPYKLKTTQPKGGVYPVISLPSFTIVPRRSNTLEAYRKAQYFKKLAIQNESYEPHTLDMFKDLEDVEVEDTVFMILDVHIDDEHNAHFSFLLPSSDMQYIHMNIPYETVLDTYRTIEYSDDEPAAATSTLKKSLQDLDKKISQQ